MMTRAVSSEVPVRGRRSARREFRTGSPANLLIGASRTASLVVVGWRIRRHPFGAHICPVTHAVLRHATASVAVVAHD
jgi:hypothetical protein